ncbi:MAG: PcrA [candidate division CPR2 bacterium GW2011_GWC2_39_10]|uniref:DNA 3'-5' helicase n=1 Tax=candidate division CPR2 bacterium GW2011_GWC2_39_10 TaxID=1618345 RepID=A0A0G0LRS9_UNCC2|nr:MAG: PcrA [candidate division CPR2 bacterium GW2011_GWC2_39_10]
MSDILSSLNSAQKEAVLATKGPVLILAGAGSGKTKALTHRIAYLVEHEKVSPFNILAVTFTNKAAKEMKIRIQKLLGSTYDFPFSGTFHSVCVKILRKEIELLGYNQRFLISDGSDQLQVIKESMKYLNIDPKQFNPRAVLGAISSAKSEMVGAAEYANLAVGHFQEIVTKIYYEYDKRLKESNALDFDDLLLKTVEIFNKFPEVLEKYQNQFHYILVDEYQDTNHVQYLFCKKLSAKHKNICVVGDDWQSIYSWRGANYRNILDFHKDYPDAKIIKLEQNYRSTKNILEAAHNVIAKNIERTDKKLWTDNESGLPVILYEAFNEKEEGQFIIAEAGRLEKQGYGLSDIAILYRTNAQSRSLEEELLKFNIPYKIIGGVRFYERREIKDLLSYLKFIYSGTDWVSFKRIINLPARGIGAKSLEVFENFARNNNLSLMDALSRVEDTNLQDKMKKGFSEFGNMAKQLVSLSNVLGVADFIEKVIIKSGLKSYYDDGSVEGDSRVENLEELISVAREFEEASSGLGLGEFLEQISLLSDIDNYSDESKSITLMTMHSAKGLEFPVVFMVGLEEGIFPHSRSSFSEEEMEEERRLCYVAMTRARKRLYLVYASNRMLYGGISSNPPSRFINDVPSHLMTDFTTRTVELKEPSFDIKAGDKIRHAKFGTGLVVGVNGEEIDVLFDSFGLKRLSSVFAPVEKIN